MIWLFGKIQHRLLLVAALHFIFRFAVIRRAVARWTGSKVQAGFGMGPILLERHSDTIKRDYHDLTKPNTN